MRINNITKVYANKKECAFANKLLKRKLAKSFFNDAFDFYLKTDLTKDNLPTDTISYLAKIYVDILMCAECSLKSLIISLSKSSQTAETAYNVARNGKSGHNLKELMDKAQERAKGKIKFISISDIEIINKANSLSVNNRYDVTNFFILLQENFNDRALNKGKITSIINKDFIDSFYYSVKKIIDIAEKAILRFYGPEVVTSDSLRLLLIRKDEFFKSRNGRL